MLQNNNVIYNNILVQKSAGIVNVKLNYNDVRMFSIEKSKFVLQLCHRTIRVDHVEEYKVPKMREDMAEEEVKMALEGCAPVP